MKGFSLLLILLLSAALPAIVVFIWFRARKNDVTLPWFLASIVAGMLSLLIAALIQRFLPSSPRAGLGPLFFGIFVRIALVEEFSRLAAIFPLYKLGRQDRDSTFYAAIGFAAGLGFAAMENATYGMADINITILRAFTAAPLHGACGIRAGRAVYSAFKSPVKAIFLFASSVIIHGAYNLMIISPALPSALAVLTAIAALIASLPYVNKSGRDRDLEQQ